MAQKHRNQTGRKGEKEKKVWNLDSESKGNQKHCNDLSDLGSIGYGRLQTRPREYKGIADSRDSSSIQKPVGNLLKQKNHLFCCVVCFFFFFCKNYRH